MSRSGGQKRRKRDFPFLAPGKGGGAENVGKGREAVEGGVARLLGSNQKKRVSSGFPPKETCTLLRMVKAPRGRKGNRSFLPSPNGGKKENNSSPGSGDSNRRETNDATARRRKRLLSVLREMERGARSLRMGSGVGRKKPILPQKGKKSLLGKGIGPGG